MSVYFAEVEEFYTWQPMGRNDGQWESRRRNILVEADDIHAAWKEAERTAEANAYMGPRHLAIEVRRVHRVTLPGLLTCCHKSNS